ncbi:hypothetical protein Hamer_G000397 [Homarus americanus]|uniref:Uncharacterized protein n=1 Tax=Homarus americanus TaxID=6706 RepID=A0A8J5TTW7_HOMAM|nr:hypothetical protein Hamer_G027440 [Homarus americanus]KAG7177153.1 hypothetical protein Hamer_G000397 [Homarus americanus]
MLEMIKSGARTCELMLEDLQEIIGQHQQQPTNEEMLEEEGDQQEEQQATQEDDVKAGELTTRKLTEVLTTITRLSEQLQKNTMTGLIL